jgi:hypothetical protein
MIAEHKAKLLAARPRFDMVWKHAMEPGREHAGLDGGKIVATDKELIHIGHNGVVLKIEPNGGRALQLVSNNENDGPSNWRFAAAFLNADGSPKFDQAARPVVKAKTGDDMLFQTYIDSGARKGRGLDGYARKEAQATWDLFRSLTKGKALEKCDRDDGRLLVFLNPWATMIRRSWTRGQRRLKRRLRCGRRRFGRSRSGYVRCSARARCDECRLVSGRSARR